MDWDGDKIPVSVLVVTKNEARNIGRCLGALKDFDEIIVIDSASNDGTQALAQDHGASVINYEWDKHYPKKRQWSLDHVATKHDWIFFVDGDEVVTSDLVDEIGALFQVRPKHDGYFVRGTYVWRGKTLRHGLKNNKLVLFDKNKIYFSVIDDLDLPGMGEIEGHYQPVLKGAGSLGQLQQALLHYAAEDEAAWLRRHERYAAWEIGMNRKNAWPRDPDHKRQRLKEIFRRLPCRGIIAFVHCYFFKLGFLDGAAGFDFARSRYRYYRMID